MAIRVGVAGATGWTGKAGLLRGGPPTAATPCGEPEVYPKTLLREVDSGPAIRLVPD